MKIHGNYKEWAVTQTQLGAILEVSQQRVNQLIDEDVVLRDETSKSGAVLLIDSLKNYYLSKHAVTDSAGGSVNFWKEKALHERAKREMTELKLSERRGELYEAATVESVMIEQLTNFRNKLLGLPAKFATRLEGKRRDEIYDTLTVEIENCLDELSKNYSDADFRSKDDEEPKPTDDEYFNGDKAFEEN